jgi:hypothetical protein
MGNFANKKSSKKEETKNKIPSDSVRTDVKILDP